MRAGGRDAIGAATHRFSHDAKYVVDQKDFKSETEGNISESRRP